jgi:hypothetical protein
MWGKLQKANLIKPVRFSDDNLFLARKHEAEERKKLISAEQASEKYTLGMTTFYSFPTLVKSRFRDVQSVEKFFRPILKDIIIPFEVDSILKYSELENGKPTMHFDKAFKVLKRFGFTFGVRER